MALTFSTADLPSPVVAELEISAHLVNSIREEIDANGGAISFERFMELALYSPQTGYYAQGKFIFGEKGDFVTSPEISPIFSQCLANQCAQIMSSLETPSIVEFGAGSGTMAAVILRTLEQKGQLPQTYYIVDVSPGLIARQKLRIATELPHLYQRVQWIESMPSDFEGVVVGNEVLDAMPGRRIKINQSRPHTEMLVVWSGDRFDWREEPISDPTLLKIAEQLSNQLGGSLPDGFITEINLRQKPWLTTMYQNMKRGAAVLIDYGFARIEWYVPERREGTLMAHYKHRAHPDPFFCPGLQDLTYHVDFTHLAEDAHEIGFHVAGFTNQALFLIGCGLESILHNTDLTDVQAFLHKAQSVKKLIMPAEMGGLFKVIALTKGVDIPLIGFSKLDQRSRL